MNNQILTNKRTKPNDFSMDHPCDFCDSFCNQVIRLPFTKDDSQLVTIPTKDNGETKSRICICKSCLSNMITALDTNMVNSFQKDFEEERTKTTRIV